MNEKGGRAEGEGLDATPHVTVTAESEVAASNLENSEGIETPVGCSPELAVSVSRLLFRWRRTGRRDGKVGELYNKVAELPHIL